MSKLEKKNAFFKNINDINFWKKDDNITIDLCKKNNNLFFDGRVEAIDYIAKLNVPLYPTNNTKQIVLGTTKYLLPYFILKDSFITFAFKSHVWSEDLNKLLINCIGLHYFKDNIIRLITTPDEMYDANNNPRTTAKELGMLLGSFKLNLYESEYKTIYFISPTKPFKKCRKVKII